MSSDETTPDRAAAQGAAKRDMVDAARAFIARLPHCAALNMTVQHLDAGQAELMMPYDTKLIGDPQSGVIHGGAVSALMDTSCGAAVMAHPSAPKSTATLDLRIDYMRPATPGQRLLARAQVFRVTRTVAFVRAVTYDENEASGPVAQATGAFTIERSTGDA